LESVHGVPGFALAPATLSLKLWRLGFDITIVAGIGLIRGASRPGDRFAQITDNWPEPPHDPDNPCDRQSSIVKASKFA
jgi:hypothetical protein